MSYFEYQINVDLFRPSNITSDMTYNESTSIPKYPMEGSYINKNFFNLAKSAVDNTTRIKLLEGLPNTVESSSKGYILYNGKREGDGYFYGGKSFVALGDGDTFALPHTLGTGGESRAFRIAAGSGIKYSSPGTIDTTTTLYRTVSFNTGGSAFQNTTTLLSYMHGKLQFNTKSDTETMSITGNVQLNTFPDWETTFGNLTNAPKSFWIFINEGYHQKDDEGTTIANGTSYVNSDGVIIGRKCTLSTNISKNLNELVSAIRIAINAQFPDTVNAGGVSVTVNNTIKIDNFNTDRDNGGNFQITFEKDIVGDGGSPGILEWLGWLPSGGTRVEAYNYQSIINFYTDSTATFHMGILGVGPSIEIAIKDSNADSGGLSGFMTSYSMSGKIGLNYHTRHPLESYSKALNYGGDMWVRDLNVRNITISGNSSLTGITLVGTVNFGSLSGTGNIAVDGTITADSTITANGNLTVQEEGTASLLGPVNISTGTGDFATVIGTNSSDILTINSTTGFNGPCQYNNTVAIGGMSFSNNNTITGVSSAIITTANITTANINTLNFSGNLQVSGTNRQSGTFNSGSTNPPLFEHGSNTGGNNIMNYDGDFKVVTLTTIGNLYVKGTIAASGSFYGGTTNPTASTRLNFDGEFYATALYAPSTLSSETTVTLSCDTEGKIIRTPSDRRLKINIEDIPYGLDTILQLQPKRFNWIEASNMGNKKSLGLIAQDILDIIPEATNGEERTYYGIDYQKIVPILIRAIQELNNKITKSPITN